MQKNKTLKKIFISLFLVFLAVTTFYNGNVAESADGDPPDLNFWIYPQVEPFQIYANPQINWPKFWNVFKNYTLWSLEGYNPNTEQWVNANSLLTIIRNYTDINTCKIGLDFTTPDNGITTNWRFTLSIDYRVKKYVNRSGDYEYTLTFEDQGNNFDVVFNWSDMLQYSGLVFKHGIKNINGNDYFWFRVRRDSIPPNFHVVLDPEYTVYTGQGYLATARCLGRQSNGTLVVAFINANDDLSVYNSEDEGETWNNIQTIGGVFIAPSLCIDSNDTIHIVFTQQGMTRPFRYINSTSWIITNVDGESHPDYHYPSIGVDSNDKLHVVYEKPTEGTSNDDQVAYISSNDNGDTWSAIQNLTNEVDNGDNEWRPIIVINSSNDLHVLFYCENYANGYDQILHIQSVDSGISWTHWESDVVTDDTAEDQHPPTAMIDKDDVIHLVWSNTSQLYQLSYAYNDSDSWSNIEVVNDYTEKYPASPSLSFSRNDNFLHVVYSIGTMWADNLTYSYHDTNIWQPHVNLTGWTHADYPNLLYARYPNNMNIPAMGYCFVYDNGTTGINFYKSDDLAFSNTTNVDTITPYWQNEVSSVSITASDTGTVDNVSLYYRWSIDNTSWDGGFSGWYNSSIDDNTGDLDSKADIGTETDFVNCQDIINDSDMMELVEADLGAGAVDEYQYVNAFDNTINEWDQNLGSQPWISADDSDYISEHSGANEQIGWFDFADTSETGNGFTIAFEFLCYGDDNNDGFEIYYDNGGGSTLLENFVITNQDAPYEWLTASTTLSGQSDTQINAMKVLFNTQNGGGGDDRYIDACRMRITRNAITDYELDFEYRFDSCSFNESFEEICFYMGELPTEDLIVQYYKDDNTWSTLGNIDDNGWNNFTAIGLANKTYYIRIYDENQTNEGIETTWNIDVMSLHLYNTTGGDQGVDWSFWNGGVNPDESSPWAWSFNFPQESGFYEFYSIANLNGDEEENPPSVRDALCHVNYSISEPEPPPFINNVSVASFPNPLNGSININVSPICNVTILDQDGNNSICDFYWSQNGVDWTWDQTNTSVLNISISFNYTNADVNFTVYYWMVTCNDGNDNVSYWFNFTTGVIILIVEADASQLGLFITLILFIFFFWIGYTSPKRSGGGFMIVSGVILISLEVLLIDLLSAVFVIPLISPIAIFILALGIRKQFFPVENEQTKTEGQ